MYKFTQCLSICFLNCIFYIKYPNPKPTPKICHFPKTSFCIIYKLFSSWRPKIFSRWTRILNNNILEWHTPPHYTGLHLLFHILFLIFYFIFSTILMYIFFVFVFHNNCTVHGVNLTYIPVLVIYPLYNRVCDK